MSPRHIFLEPNEEGSDSDDSSAGSYQKSFSTLQDFHSQNTSNGIHLLQTKPKNREIDFMEVVDEDETQGYEDYVSEVLAGRLVESTAFRLTILIAILLNTVLVGLQTSNEMVWHLSLSHTLSLSFFLSLSLFLRFILSVSLTLSPCLSLSLFLFVSLCMYVCLCLIRSLFVLSHCFSLSFP